MTESSSDKLRESLSALMDDQASDMEIRRIVKTLGSDSQLKDCWRRYTVASAVLKQEWRGGSTADLAESICSAIEDEPSYNYKSDKSIPAKTWTGRLGQVAIAASVAFVFVFGVQQFSYLEQESPGVGALANIEPSANLEPLASLGSNEDLPLNSVVSDGLNLPPLGVQTVSSAGNNLRVPQTFVKQGQASQWLTDPKLQSHLSHLLIQHAEQSSASGGMGMLPFARVSRLEPAGE